MTKPWEQYQDTEQSDKPKPWERFQEPKQKKEEQPEQEESSNLIASKITSDAQVEEIAESYGVDAEWLKSTRGWLGGTTASLDPRDIAKELAGAAGSTILGPIPGFVMKKLQGSTKRRQAMDALIEKINENKSYAQDFGEILGGLGGLGIGAKVATKVPKAAKLAAVPAVGSVYGMASSREGEELEGAIAGGVLSSLFVAAPSVVSKVYSKTVKSPKARAALNKTLEERSDTITRKTEEAFKKISPKLEKERELLDKIYTKDFDTFSKKTKPEVITELLSSRDVKQALSNSPMNDRLKLTLDLIDQAPTPDNLLKARAYEKAHKIAKRIGANSEEGIEELARTMTKDKLVERYDDAVVFTLAKRVAGTQGYGRRMV